MKIRSLIYEIVDGLVEHAVIYKLLNIENKHERAGVCYELGLAYFERGKYQEAEAFIENAFFLSEYNETYAGTLISSYIKNKNYDGIRSIYKSLGLKYKSIHKPSKAISFFNAWHTVYAKYAKEDKFDYDFEILNSIKDMAKPHLKDCQRKTENRKIKIGYLVYGMDQPGSVIVKGLSELVKGHNADYDISVIFPFSKNEILSSDYSSKYLSWFRDAGCELIFSDAIDDLFTRLINLAEKIDHHQLDIFVTTAGLADYSHYFLAMTRPARYLVALLQGPPPQYVTSEFDYCISWSFAPFLSAPSNGIVVNGVSISKADQYYLDKNRIFAARKTLDIPESAVILLSAGRHVKFQDEGYWTEINTILHDHENAYFLVVGALKDQIGLHCLNKLSSKVLNRITFLGWQSDPSHFVAIADIVIDTFPNGGGVTVSDAIALKKPVVAFRNDIFKKFDQRFWRPAEDYLDGVEILLDCYDFSKFREVVQRLIHDSGYRQYISNQVYEKHLGFSKNLKTADRCEILYDNIIKRCVKFSIIMPTYNQAGYIADAIDSVIAQSCHDWELIIVDDGSTDNTANIIMGYENNDSRIKGYFKENGGVASALNYALRRSKGEWILWLSSDDMFLPNKLELHLNAIQEFPLARFFHTHYFFLDDSNGIKTKAGHVLRILPENGKHIIKFFESNYINGISICINKSLFDEAGEFDEKLRYAQDFDMWLRLCLRSPLIFLDEPTCITRLHTHQSTNGFPEACVIESSIALLKLLNEHSFEELFQFLDSDNTINSVLTIFKNCNNHIHACGHSLLLLRMFNEWLNNQIISDKSKKAIEDFSKSVPDFKFPQALKHELKNIGIKLDLPLDHMMPPSNYMKMYAHMALKESIVKLGGISPQSIIDYCEKFLHETDNLTEYPLISIIVPTCNRAFMLKDALQSIKIQTYPHWEVVVVNEGLEDVREEVSTILGLGNFRYIQHRASFGLSAARNTGLRLCSGSIICFLDDDDLFLPGHLQTIVEAMQGTSIPIVYTDADTVLEVVEADFRIEKSRSNPYRHEDFSKDLLAVQNYIPVNTWACRWECFHKIGFFDETLKSFEDWDVLLRLSRHYTFVHIAKATVEVRRRINIKDHMTDRERSTFPQLYRKIYERTKDFETPEIRIQRNKLLGSFETNNGSRVSVTVNQNRAEVVDPYRAWQKKHAVVEADGQILAERMHNWNVAPNFLILTIFESTTTDLLADTIDSLNRQFYNQWSLAIISVSPSPNPIFDELDMVHWLQVDDDPYQSINQVLANVDAFDWVTIIPPGAIFSEYALSVVSNYINKNPEWCFIYSDEDLIDNNGAYIDPLFKPDFNLELLRSTPYIGDACFFRKSVIDELGGCCGLAGVLNWDLSFKIFERLGASSIGHVPEILFHRPIPSISETEQQYLIAAEKLTVLRHLERLQINATVTEGLAPKTYFVDYPILNQPLVSIVLTIVNEEQLSWLNECIEALAKNTEYSNYEIILTSLLPEPDLLKIVGESNIVAKYIRYIPFQGNLISPLSNQALKTLNGEYVLLFSPDLTVLHQHWLETLMAHGLRDEVGIVGAKIVDTHKNVHHAGIVLGMGDLGVADYPSRNLPINQPGYMNRAAVVQNFSAVSTQCFLVKKHLLLELPVNTETHIFEHIDFCLHVSQKGYAIVWTPFVTLMLAHQVLQEYPMDQLRSDANQMIKSWLPYLANDPAYNRNLSLKHRHFQIETETDVTWNVDFHDRPRVYAFPANDSGVGEYRVRSPLRALTHAAKIQSSLLPNHSETLIPDIVEIERAKPDVLLLQNGTASYLLHAWEQYRKFNDVFMIYSQDDLIYMLPGKHPLQGKWPKDLRKRLRKLLEHSDRLIVATEPLKEEYSRWISDVKIVPNYLEKAKWLNLTVNSKQREGKKLRVGWAGGAQHQGDLEFILPVVEATKNEVDWIFMGMCPEQIRPFIKEYHAGVVFDLYPQKLADLDLDLAIAPLEYNNFNMAKTNLRLLEYGVLGWPVVCSDITPYRNTPVTRVSNNVNHWIKTIREKINEPDALIKEGQVLKQWVLDHFMLEDHLDEWMAAITPNYYERSGVREASDSMAPKQA